MFFKYYLSQHISLRINSDTYIISWNGIIVPVTSDGLLWDAGQFKNPPDNGGDLCSRFEVPYLYIISDIHYKKFRKVLHSTTIEYFFVEAIRWYLYSTILLFTHSFLTEYHPVSYSFHTSFKSVGPWLKTYILMNQGTAKPPSWGEPICKMDGGLENVDLNVWMRIAGLPNFRKPWRKLNRCWFYWKFWLITFTR